jgi:hypothetical protein
MLIFLRKLCLPTTIREQVSACSRGRVAAWQRAVKSQIKAKHNQEFDAVVL